MVRAATLADLDQLEVLGMLFAKEAKASYNIGAINDFFVTHIKDPYSTVLLSENGVLVGQLGRFVADPDVLFAQELINYVKPSARQQGEASELIDEFEKWALYFNVKWIDLGAHVETGAPEKLDAYYNRIGYQPAQVHYRKFL